MRRVEKEVRREVEHWWSHEKGVRREVQCWWSYEKS